MSPDDPRHGQRKGYYAHRRDNEEACDACKRGAASAQARHEMNRDNGRPGRVSPIGTRRRLQALAALGWSWVAIDQQLGVVRLTEKWINEPRDYVYATTAARVAELYDRLSMQFPPQNTPEEKSSATRARNMAARKGWPPPLAWERIDDPNERPRGWRATSEEQDSRGDILAELDDMLLGITDACRVLKVKREAIEKWCERNDMRDVYERLIAREQPRHVANQYMERTA